jgi:hypothetical protein
VASGPGAGAVAGDGSAGRLAGEGSAGAEDVADGASTAADDRDATTGELAGGAVALLEEALREVLDVQAPSPTARTAASAAQAATRRRVIKAA